MACGSMRASRAILLSGLPAAALVVALVGPAPATAGVPPGQRALVTVDPRQKPPEDLAKRLQAEDLPRAFLPQDPDSRQAIQEVIEGRASEATKQVVAQTVAIADRAATNAPAIVVSGGISLGAYQAGVIATLARFWHVASGAGPDPRPRIWTGASAGSVNALLGGIAGCDRRYGAPVWRPEETLFWEVWVKRLDLDALLPRDYERRTDHLFSDHHMQRTIDAILEAARQSDLEAGCSFAYGITATNLGGRRIPFGERSSPSAPATLTRVTEKIALQVRVTEEGALSARLPFLWADPSAGPGAEQARVQQRGPHLEVSRSELEYYAALGVRPAAEGGQHVPIESLFSAPKASGAFPLAFPPVSLPMSVFHEGAWQEARGLTFIDGGVLNNNPLDLAHRLGNRWREGPGRGFEPLGEGPFRATFFPVIYLDQDFVTWQWKAPVSKEGCARSVAGAAGLTGCTVAETYLRHAPTLMGAARDAAVLDVLENAPELSGLVKIPRRNAVLPSEYRFAMLGFADRHFREHDFYRGMDDAIRFLASQLDQTASVKRLGITSADELRRRLGIESAGFRCVVANQCDGLPALASVRGASVALTNKAASGQLEHDRIEDLLDALKAERYVYADGIMGRAVRAQGTREDLERLRVRAGIALGQLVSSQDRAERLALRPVGMAFLDDWLTYRPPRAAGTLGFSRDRGLSAGLEFPLRARERRDEVSDRAEWRLGGDVASLGRRDADQRTLGDVRLRWVTLVARADYVSDFDGLGGRFKALQLGPYVRWRAGPALTAAWLRDPDEFVYAAELGVGVDLLELVGVRLAFPVAHWRHEPGGAAVHHRPALRELSVRFDVLSTGW